MPLISFMLLTIFIFFNSCVSPEEPKPVVAVSAVKGPTNCHDYTKEDKQMYAWKKTFSADSDTKEKESCLSMAVIGLDEEASKSILSEASLNEREPQNAESFCNWLAEADAKISNWSIQTLKPFSNGKDNLLSQNVSALFATAPKSSCSYLIPQNISCTSEIANASAEIKLRRNFCMALNKKDGLSARSLCFASAFKGLGNYSAKVILRKMNLKSLNGPFGAETQSILNNFTSKAQPVVKRYMKTSFSMEPILQQALERDALYCSAFRIKGNIGI